MKTHLIAFGMTLLSTTAGATIVPVCTPDPLLGARAIAFSVEVGGTMSPVDEPAKYLFSGQPEAQAAFEVRLTSAIERKLRVAGYDFETDSDVWSTRDRKIYDGTGIPHYSLYVSVYGQTLDPPNCDCTSNAFLVYVNLDAEFLAPAYESVRTYSFERLGMATDAELESEIVAVTAAMVDDILDPSLKCPPFEKRTLFLEGGRYSLDLTPSGYGELLRYLRGEFYGEPVVADLYSEPRSSSAKPLVTFPLVNGVPPKRILRDEDSRFVVALHTWPRRGFDHRPLVVIYRPDGSIQRSLSLKDLLNVRDRMHIAIPATPDQWPYADHSIDEGRNVLLLSIPTCLFFEQDCSDRYAQLEVDLASGQRAHPDRDVAPQWEGRLELILSQKHLADEDQARRTAYTCSPGWSAAEFVDLPEIPPQDLLPDSILPMPVYTTIATKARVTGTVELEILITESGEVACAGIRKGLPMGLDQSAIKTVLTWKLSPPQSHTGRSRSYVEFRCHFVLMEPGESSAASRKRRPEQDND